MMVYKWPRQLLKSLDTEMWNFVWNKNVAKQNYGTVAWARVCAMHKEGRLGVCSIRAMNKGFF